ncbi:MULTISPECIES: hypothetical protein [Photorhabdus]|uniref:hypothetical protein n=1 Tax=Photorhabdus TaxID=29487 RepID=UPI00059C01E9|nr:hypothetical protein [Photorhabdus asymbiotica]
MASERSQKNSNLKDEEYTSLMKSLKVTPSRLTGGNIKVSGFKHAVTLVMAASVALNNKVIIRNVPHVLDTIIISQIINELGGTCIHKNDYLEIICTQLNTPIIPPFMADKIHGSIYLIPVLLGKLGQVTYQSFGGCTIGQGGSRPIKHMLSVLTRFGASFSTAGETTTGYTNGFSACSIDIMDYSDVADELTGSLVSGATKTAILAAMFVTNGQTVIQNPYMKPDVTELLDFLSTAGYRVSGTSKEIIIEHGTVDSAENTTRIIEMTLVSDVSEIITYLTLSVLAKVSIQLECKKIEKVQSGLCAEITLFKEMGIDVNFNKDKVFILKVQQLYKSKIIVKSHGIYSDHQPFFALLMCYADGHSCIEERVWAERFAYVPELKKLGANIAKCANRISIFPNVLHDNQTEVFATDLRAAAVLLIASLIRGGETTIKGAHHLERGYSNMLANLRMLNANVETIE